MITFPRGREVVLGVGAGIAAYKSCDLLRRLQDLGFLVTVVPTSASLNFVGKATWEALSGRPVRSQVWEGTQEVSHVELANRADLILIAPATADLIARIASGHADDLLTTTVLASNAKVIVVPSMHPGMYLNPATQANLELLRSRNIEVLEPDTGRLTGADSGIGRFPETKRILECVSRFTDRTGKLSGKRVLVTAGGTIEAIDAVRYIGNRSSGRQGLALAFESLSEGAEVSLIAANTEEFELPGAKLVKVESAKQMQVAVEEGLADADILIMAAAVADARPTEYRDSKIHKDNLREISLTTNEDILANASRSKRYGQIFVGFAAETGDEIVVRGRKKLHAKGVDLLYVTDVTGGRVFGDEKTTGTLISRNGREIPFDSVDKFEVARNIISEVAAEIDRRRG